MATVAMKAGTSTRQKPRRVELRQSSSYGHGRARSIEPGRFGVYGGRYVPETLMAALQELDKAYAAARKDKLFREEFHRLLTEYAHEQDLQGKPFVLRDCLDRFNNEGMIPVTLMETEMIPASAREP